MRRAVLSTFLFVAILGLGCMGVVTPGRTDELKHPIVLKPKCQEHFDKYLDKVQQNSSFYYSSFAYVSGSLGYACAYREGTEEALAACNSHNRGWCKVYAKSPVNGKVAIVWDEEPNKDSKKEPRNEYLAKIQPQQSSNNPELDSFYRRPGCIEKDAVGDIVADSRCPTWITYLMEDEKRKGNWRGARYQCDALVRINRRLGINRPPCKTSYHFDLKEKKQQWLIRAQTALNTLGLNAGKADDISTRFLPGGDVDPGPKTRNAINRWLNANNLATRQLTEVLVARMERQAKAEIARRLAGTRPRKERKLTEARTAVQKRLAELAQKKAEEEERIRLATVQKLSISPNAEAVEGYCYQNYSSATSWISKASCNRSGGIIVTDNGQLRTCQKRRLSPEDCYRLVNRYADRSEVARRMTGTKEEVVRHASDLIVRQFPSGDAIEIAYLRRNSEFTVQHKTNTGWAYVKFSNGRHGYVRAKDLNQVTAEKQKPKVDQQQRLELARRTQEALQVLGLYSGKLDGIIGVKTRSAIQRWQKRNGYTGTGEVTEAQLAKLEQEAITQLAEKESEAKAEKERKLAAAKALEGKRLAAIRAEKERKAAIKKAAEDKRLAEQNKVLNALRKKHRHAVAVIIGNRDYEGRTPNVEFAHNDADAIRSYVIKSLGFRERNIIDLRDTSLTQLNAVFGSPGNHKAKAYSYVRRGKSDLVVFYSGHGVPGLKDNKGYLLPVNADPDLVEHTSYPIDVMLANLAKIDSRSTTIFIDACFSGDSPRGMLVRATSGISIKPKMPSNTGGMVVITAAHGNQFASWDEDAKLGLFTKHLLEGLQGIADDEEYGNQDGKVTLEELRGYLDDEMTFQARRRWNREQRVTVKGDPGTIMATLR